jgi:outer membrane protein
MKPRYIITNLLLLLLFAGNTFAQSYTLQQAIDFALKNHTTVKNSELDVEIAKAKVSEYVGVGLPQINAKGEITRYIDLPTQFIPAEFFGGEPGTYAPVQFGQNYSATAGISASQLLFDGSYLIGLKATRIYAELARKQLTETRIDVAVKVSKAYYMVLVARERLAQLDSDVVRVEKIKSDTKAMLDNGFVEKIDYDRVELNYNLLLNARDNTKRMTDNSLELLKFQMGLPLNSEITLLDKTADITYDAAILTKDSVDANTRIEFDILKTRERLTGLDLKRYRSLRLPSLSMNANLSTTASRDDFTIFDPSYKWYPFSLVGATLSFPIFNGFTKSAQIKQAYLTNQKVKNSFNQLREGIQLEYKNAVANYNNSLNKMNTQSKNRELAREIARVSKIKYEQGVGSSLELIDAESALRESETNYYTALLELLMSKTDLDRASGTINY